MDKPDDPITIASEDNMARNPDVITAYDDETVIWEGGPSQWVNLSTFLWWGIVCGGLFFCNLIWSNGLSEGYPALVNTIIHYASMAIYTVAAINTLYVILAVRYEHTTITHNKIKESHGVTKIFQQDLFCELSDVTDIKSPPAGLLALVGLASIIIETNDNDQPIIKIRAIRNRSDVVNRVIPVWRKLRQDRKGFFPG